MKKSADLDVITPTLKKELNESNRAIETSSSIKESLFSEKEVCSISDNSFAIDETS